jgi:signal transduction histidine kinase
MRLSFALKVAAPMLSLGILLFALSVFAAWKVHQQQTRSSEMVAREVHGLSAVGELHITMREIRYQLNLFLRTKDRQFLRKALDLDRDARAQLKSAEELVRNSQEHKLLDVVDAGYRHFHEALQQIATPVLEDGSPPASEYAAHLAALADERLTDDVLAPLFDSMVVNQQVLDRMDRAGQTTAWYLAVGLLVLGACGGAAGLLLGIAASRAIGRSLVQITVSVEGLAGKLSNVCPPVTFAHSGDPTGIQSALAEMERGITSVVERLRRSESELLRREQLARVGQLAAGMAHELRNPLMPMKMLVQAAIERRDVGLAGRSLEVVNEEITRLENSIQVFLDFARPALPQTAVVDIREIIAPTLELVSARATRQGITLASHLPDQPVMLRVDRGQIRQLLLNFLLNSMDAMPHGGHLEVAVDDRHAPAPTGDEGAVVASDSTRPDPCCTIRVMDDGIGIAEDVLPTVFEPFVTTKESGAGLGLSLCTSIAAAHRGRITARNRLPRGAEFCVELPAEESA